MKVELELGLGWRIGEIYIAVGGKSVARKACYRAAGIAMGAAENQLFIELHGGKQLDYAPNAQVASRLRAAFPAVDAM